MRKRIFSATGAVALAMLTLTAAVAQAAQVGIKYNRAPAAYPDAVIHDMQRLHEARIDTIMLCLPWNQWEHDGPQINEDFIRNGLAPVLRYCRAHGMSVMISNHSVYWGAKGNWSIPRWIRAKPGFETATQCLTDPKFRKLQAQFLIDLVEATHKYDAVFAYNLLNEPVAATENTLHTEAFQNRWQGVIEICKAVRQYVDEHGIGTKLLIGNSYDSASQTGRYVWVNTGKYDLRPLWTHVLDYVAAQGVGALSQAEKFYPHLPAIRTESRMNFNKLRNARENATNFDWDNVDFHWRGHWTWDPKADHYPVYYDYDAAYSYEGLADAAVPNLKAFYPWRIGTPRGHDFTFFDYRKGHHARAVPYFYALRDLASGVDSFETFARDSLPANGKETRTFDPTKGKPGISARWTGSGIILGQKEDVPDISTSTLAARVMLEPGQRVTRSVVSAHWRDSGVKPTDAFCFLAKTDHPVKGLELVVTIDGKQRIAALPVIEGAWSRYELPLSKLGIKVDDIRHIQSVGFKNLGPSKVGFDLDEFLIRPATGTPRQPL